MSEAPAELLAARVDEALVRDVDLLCLDAGNTVIFLDHERLAAILRDVGFEVPANVLVRAEGEAKRLAETGDLHDVAFRFRERAGGRAWGKMVGTIVVRAGLDPERVPLLLDAAWEVHATKNLWCRVPPGLGRALDEVRGRGVRVAIISNSEGMLARLFAELEIARHFDLVVDSGLVGFEKPDARIFEIALKEFAIAAQRALHLGDVYATDVLGARAAGIRHALIDPYGHYAGRHLDVPRVPDVATVAHAIARSRR